MCCWLHLGLSKGWFGLGLCPTQNQPDGIGWQKISLVNDRRGDRIGSDRIGFWVRRIGFQSKLRATDLGRVAIGDGRSGLSYTRRRQIEAWLRQIKAQRGRSSMVRREIGHNEDKFERGKPRSGRRQRGW